MKGDNTDSKTTNNNELEQQQNEDLKQSHELYLDRYQIIKTIGEGSFGKVKLAKDIRANREVAIKIIRQRKKSKDVFGLNPLDGLRREGTILKMMNHPNVVKFFKTIKTSDDLVLVTEYISGIELLQYVNEHKCLSDSLSRYVFKQLLSALEYLHHHFVVHRDLKPENVLVLSKPGRPPSDTHPRVKLIDFGMGKFVTTVDKNTYCGTVNYMAPEVISKNRYGKEVDIWSLGVILYIMAAGNRPFRDKDPIKLEQKIKEAEFPLSAKFSDDLVDLLLQILVVNPAKRASLDDISMHPWVTRDGPSAEFSLDRDIPVRSYPLSEREIDRGIVELMRKSSYPFSYDDLLSSHWNLSLALYFLVKERRDMSEIKTILNSSLGDPRGSPVNYSVSYSRNRIESAFQSQIPSTSGSPQPVRRRVSASKKNIGNTLNVPGKISTGGNNSDVWNDPHLNVPLSPNSISSKDSHRSQNSISSSITSPKVLRSGAATPAVRKLSFLKIRSPVAASTTSISPANGSGSMGNSAASLQSVTSPTASKFFLTSPTTSKSNMGLSPIPDNIGISPVPDKPRKRSFTGPAKFSFSSLIGRRRESLDEGGTTSPPNKEEPKSPPRNHESTNDEDAGVRKTRTAKSLFSQMIK